MPDENHADILEFFIARWSALDPKPLIHVSGDTIIDEYYDVSVDRISPESPVPVWRVSSDPVALPGGAANVAYQAKHFGGAFPLTSHLGTRALKLLTDLNFPVDSCLSAFYCENPVKQRYHAGGVPLGRVDRESAPFPCRDSYSRPRFPAGVDCWIYSDYNKGFFDHPRPWATLGAVTVVDPKSFPLERWRGCTIFKPNAAEAAALSGLDHNCDQAPYFMDHLSCKYVVITRGADGFVCFDGRHYEEFDAYPPPPARSVVGAGDCFTAFLTMAYMCGMEFFDAAVVAWYAGAAYVRNFPPRPVTPRELVAAADPVRAKYRLPEPDRSYKLIFTNGCFDIIHPGHLSTLRFARAQGDALVVAVNSDDSVRRLKGPGRPAVPLADRMALLAALPDVDFVVPFEGDDLVPLVESINPSLIVKGGDYAGEDVAGGWSCPVALAPFVPGHSTTSSVEKIRACP